MRYRRIWAIDPDCEKSGLAMLDTITRRLEMYSMPFPILVEKLRDGSMASDDDILLVEASWLIPSNWHITPKDSKEVAASKGNSVGRNQEVGRKIIEVAVHHGVNAIEFQPLAKKMDGNFIWSGKDGKITHDDISAFIFDIDPESNQEKRDAALIAWRYAGFPIKMPKKWRK